MPSPLRLDEVRGFEYVEVDQGPLRRLRLNLRNNWGKQTPIANCARCGRYTNDSNRDIAGGRLHENPDDDHEVVCQECAWSAYADARKRSIEHLIDARLDLGEEDRRALKKVVELVVTQPDKVLELKDLGNRVRGLERQTVALWVALGVAIALLAIVGTVAVVGI